MKLNIGQRIKLKPYNKVVDMFNKNQLIGLSSNYPTGENCIYGLRWSTYQELCKETGTVEYINRDDYFISFDNGREFDIPPILIQNICNIELPDNLFEL